jgi:hypothetical protein
MSPETQAMSLPAAADEIVWLQALHAVELCQQVAELAARADGQQLVGDPQQGESGVTRSAAPRRGAALRPDVLGGACPAPG